ncbi:MAG: alanine--tRNA ligase [Candidatus Nezhaarchaeota archaeon]|nr:alanine--tRNA ligase [Candidatus Nezhaarchaeota archaeon]
MQPEEGQQLKFFLDNGFVRKACRNCGVYFWTLDEGRQDCGDSPCAKYDFIGRPPLKHKYSLREVRKAFLDFFERHAHTVVEPYPVVARWREDLYLTIASIALFQPFVTDGIVPPPANPLVVSQPCIRLLDIDRVGATAGRHLTIFEMGGAHAFNYEHDWKYWKDQTVELCHLFLTEDLGVSPELITYKEGFWEGGGNAGPDVEVCIKGLELATLVFMMYRVKDGSYEEMPVKVVDTGYGMERFAWISTGHPTAFHATYGPLLEEFERRLGIRGSIDWGLVASAVEGLSVYPAEESVSWGARVKVAKSLGVSPSELDYMLKSMEKLCTLLDHTKCLAFMLADGVVPSNAGEGYLARLVLRRAMRALRALKCSVGLKELVDLQLSYWGRDYPRLRERREVVLEEVELEEERYREALTRGRKVVEQRLSELVKRGVELMVELYDSHGVPPDLICEVAEERGVKVEVPSDFYALVAKLHEKPLAQKLEVKIPIESLRNLPATRLLFYESPYLMKFRAKVIRSLGDYVVLDSTCFYPEGGGQPCDIGELVVNGERVKVLEVFKEGDVVIHKTSRPIPEGTEVEGVVDEERRLSLMRHHTATHIIIGSARRVLGSSVWQAGAQKGVEQSRVDITFHRKITHEEVAEIERLANEVVMRSLPVRASFIEREVAEAIYGFTLYQGGVAPGRYIRVVEVAGWDAQACGGVHVANTGEVGPIRILRAYRIQDGVERLEFMAGIGAVKHFRSVDSQLAKTAEVLETPVERVAEAARQLKEELKKVRRELDRARTKVASLLSPILLKEAQRIGEVKLVKLIEDGAGREELIKIGEAVIKSEPMSVVILASKLSDGAAVVIMAGRKAIELGIHAGKLASRLCEALGGRGGGREELGQGGGPSLNQIEEALKVVEEEVKRSIRL